MVSTQKEKVLWVLYLESQKQKNGLNLHGTSTLVVSKEKVVGIWRPSLFVENLAQVGELSMDISDYLDRRLQLKEYGLVGEDVHAGQTQLGDVLFADLDVFVAILLLLRQYLLSRIS